MVRPVHIMELRYPPRFLHRDQQVIVCCSVPGRHSSYEHPKKSDWTYVLVLHGQSPDVVVGPGLLRLLENTEKSVYATLDASWSEQNGRNAFPISVVPFPIREERLLTQEILKGPKLKGSSLKSGKYRSHFFCTQKNQESLLSERKEAPAHCSHTGARCQRGRRRKRRS